MRGRVTNIKYTQGGAGNQWTYIDGVPYATFWDIRTKDWHLGDEVEFDVVQRVLWMDGTPPVPHAQNITKVK